MICNQQVPTQRSLNYLSLFRNEEDLILDRKKKMLVFYQSLTKSDKSPFQGQHFNLSLPDTINCPWDDSKSPTILKNTYVFIFYSWEIFFCFDMLCSVVFNFQQRIEHGYPTDH